MWPKILEVLSRLILETYCERYPYAMLLLNFFFSIFLLQNFKFTCCLGRFHHWITLNLIKYVLFGHTARTHACPAFLLWLDCDISVTWTFVWHAFFYFCNWICLALMKKINSFFYLKLDVLYSCCVEVYQPFANYPHRGILPEKRKLNDLSLICPILEILD